ncbi:MAG: lysophospholipase [Myxococcota bacterium]|jgi:lysophospholipase
MTFVATEHDPIPDGAELQWLTAQDGTRFRVARFGSTSAPKGTVVILNGRTEFIEKYFEVTNELIARGYAVATLDWRGQGMSDRALDDRHKGHVENFDLFVSDLHQAIVDFVKPGCPAPYRMLCHSMGGNIGLRYLGAHSETFESAVFSAPMWGIGKNPRTPGWMRVFGRLTNAFGISDWYIPGGHGYRDEDREFTNNNLTHDKTRFAHFVAQVDKEPALELGAPTLGWVRQAIKSMDILHAPGFAEKISIPITVCSAGDDALVSNASHKLIVDRLPNGQQIEIKGAKHELMVEIETHRKQFFDAFHSR